MSVARPVTDTAARATLIGSGATAGEMPSEDDTGMEFLSSRQRTEPLRRDEVDEFQRMRIISAMVEVSSELGYVGAAVAPVVARAGVSRRTFYELFDGREDCFLAAFEWGASEARDVVVEAYSSNGSWRERMRRAVTALLALLECEPQLARVCVIEALGAGKLVLQRRAELLDALIAALDAEAPRPRGASAEPLLTAEGVVGGAFSVLHGRLLEDTPSARLGELHGQLTALIALPYLGPRAAGEEFTRAAPDVASPKIAHKRGEDGGGRLLERLDMRLTYRTVRCLLFIAENPASSNREIARGAEISDEGQASKLLARLVKLDLIVNSQAGGPGRPNRWALTAHGEQVLSAVKARRITA